MDTPQDEHDYKRFVERKSSSRETGSANTYSLRSSVSGASHSREKSEQSTPKQSGKREATALSRYASNLAYNGPLFVRLNLVTLHIAFPTEWEGNSGDM